MHIRSWNYFKNLFVCYSNTFVFQSWSILIKVLSPNIWSNLCQKCASNQIFPACQWCSFWHLFEAAQEAGKQTQETIEKAADKATNTIKEFGRRVDGKWSVKRLILADAPKQTTSQQGFGLVIILAWGKNIYSANIPQ